MGGQHSSGKARPRRRESDHVKPLGLAENQFLQVLLDEVKLHRHRDGVRLSINLCEKTPAIWSRFGKAHLRQSIPDFAGTVARVQSKLDHFLIDGRGRSLSIREAGYCFRYGGGGTLPMIRIGDEEYFCLFYREIHPIGWNIANGGSDSTQELLSPEEVIERELREELIIVNPSQNCRYVLRGESEDPLDRPEYRVARRLLHDAYPGLDLLNMTPNEVALKWLDGPDRLDVTIGPTDRPKARQTYTTENCYINANAEDFGIEIDRVAWIDVDPGVIIMDGELTEDAGARPINAPVGLFRVPTFLRELEAGSKRFIPDILFHAAQQHDGAATADVVKDDFVPSIAPVIGRDAVREWEESYHPYDLCPVTRTLVQRTHDQFDQRPRRRKDYEVFISFANDDKAYAERVYRAIKKRKGDRVFFSGKTLHDVKFARAIDAALESADSLIVVGSKLHHLSREWVEYEWLKFETLIRNRRKPAGQIIPFIQKGIDPAYLPGPLMLYNAIHFSPEHIEDDVNHLLQLEL